VVITPHPREAARLLETTTEAVTADAPAAARTAADRFGCTVLLKGQPSLVVTPGLTAAQYGWPSEVAVGRVTSWRGLARCWQPG
jgi:NAD(P)H-hydrate repair Nnr-like enzyme with NAD(P)H-hydrate dehydratase domain